MLADLMQSLQALDVPQGADLLFIFVENDAQLTIAEAVDEFHKRSGWPAFAFLEPRIGISHARNAALEAATAEGAHWMAFVDDDEQVRRDWLRLLWTGAREAGAHLAGGPVLPVAPRGGCSDEQGQVLRYYERAAALSDARKLTAASAGKRFDLATNNWLADLEALNRNGLRFDPAYGLSGGEDTDLSRRAHGLGLELAWVPAAVVTEEVPPERLTGAYIRDRARAQSITKFRLMEAAKPRAASLRALAQVVSKGLAGAVRVLISPLAGRYSYYRGLRSLGIAQGFWDGVRGKNQASYSNVTGS